jgi:type I restriction enzyme, R subunit
MNKKELSERDICSKFISPAIKRAGWDGMMQIREEVGLLGDRKPWGALQMKILITHC